MNPYKDIDYNSLQEAEAILSGELEADDRTKELVENWYGRRTNITTGGNVPVLRTTDLAVGKPGTSVVLRRDDGAGQVTG